MFSIDYRIAFFTIEKLIIESLEQIYDGQPDPELWLERARAANDAWYEMAIAGGIDDIRLNTDHNRLAGLIMRAENSLK